MLIAIVHKFYLTALRHRISNLSEAYPSIIEECLQLILMLVANLDHHTRVLGEECLYDVCRLQVVEVDVKSALCICEAHLKQCCDKSTCRDIVSCHYPSALYEFLYGVEALHEVIRILHRRHIITYAVKTLCESRAAEALAVEAEVYMV